MRIFPDSDVVIFLVEDHPKFRPLVDAALSDLQTGSLMTCAMVQDYHHFYRTSCQSHVVTETTFDLALTLRARHRLKSPDAINLACAIQSGSEVFLINDRDYKTVTEIRIVSIHHYANP